MDVKARHTSILRQVRLVPLIGADEEGTFMTDITVIILTKDEEKHIGRCLERLLPLEPKRVVLIDCFSSDRTSEIALSWNAKWKSDVGGKVDVVEHEWPGQHSKQLNWALDNCNIDTEWVLRLDADEYLMPETCEEVKSILADLPAEITSLSIERSHIFYGRMISHGGTSRIPMIRFFRRRCGRCEDRAMDEHIVTSEGRDMPLKGLFVDHNLNDLRWWTEKHLGYARREAVDAVNGEQFKRAKGWYYRLPPFIRPFLYFVWRYLVRLGFLDGKAGFLWHFLQGWWYRTIVDVEIAKLKNARVGK